MVSPAPVVIAAIDAGSNAIRMTVAAATPGAGFVRLESERAPVRLGHRAFTRGELDRSTLEAAVGVFARFAARFAHHGVQQYRAVGTSALRTAENRELLLHRLYHETGIELSVIDADEEARLVRRAVQSVFGDRPAPGLMLDLGGGSLELSWRVNRRWKSRSLAVGTVRLLETLDLQGALDDEETRAVQRSVRALLRTLRPKLPEVIEGDVVATGGNPEALAALFGEKAPDGLPVLDLRRLRAELPTLLAASVDQRMERYGVARDRAEVMGVAALVLSAAGEVAGFEKLLAPGVGIRDGLLHEMAASLPGGGVAERDAREQALVAASLTFAHHLGHDTTHGERVRQLARLLFDQLAPLHGLPPELGALLEVSAVLHDVGEVVNRQSHHKHGEYLVRNGRILGLEPPHREMAACVVRAHRRSHPDPRRHETYGALPPERQAEVRKLAALLRVADALDTDHRQRVEDLRVRTTAEAVELSLVLHPLATERVIPQARKHELFEQELGRRLVLDAAEGSAP